MHLLLPLAALLGIEVDVLVDRLKKSLIVSTAMGLFVLIGLCFLLVAVNNALTLWLGPVWGPLALAGGALLVALIIYGVARIVAGNRKIKAVERRRSSETSAFVTSAALTALPLILRSPMARNLGLPLAAIAAFVMLTRKGGPRDDQEY